MGEFNITDYVRGIQQSLIATSGYEFCRVSDPKAMEEVIQNSKRCDRFFALDDSQNEVRCIYQKIVSRLIRDRERYEALAYIADDSIPFDEIPGEFAGGTAGLFFTFTVDIPLNLEYNGADWQ